MKKTKSKSKSKTKPVSQLRQDIVTGDWVIIATGRSKKPNDFIKEKPQKTDQDSSQSQLENCPFCYPTIEKQKPDTLIYYKKDKEWSLRVFPNKFPALTRKQKTKEYNRGIYLSLDGTGFHEVIVTRDHERGVPQLLKEEVAEVIDSFKTRYLDLMKKRGVKYILFIENHGEKSGASVVHPHWQIFAIPVISPGVRLELEGSKRYQDANKTCVYCDMIEQEIKTKKRIVAKNRSFVAFCPYASRSAFEVWILPRVHQPYFERISETQELEAAAILKKVLERYYHKLNDIPYNMYLHTSPCNGEDYRHYHWHIELLPKTSIWAGFELGTGIEISTIEPQKAAQFLKKS
ncbi:MAG: galactose-1-phosphate uridylyltransferase [Patescibacteria group bacterium]|nr:galactose-1-phosphate uridylyltransferase [Patescibacteria group bacterium]